MVANELSKPRRIELILRQIDSLPTLPAVATRLLMLTASEDTHAKEVIELIRSDPAITSKILSLCRTADKGIKTDVLTLDRAVVLLGFNAVRNAVLSMKVLEIFGDEAQHKGGAEDTTEASSTPQDAPAGEGYAAPRPAAPNAADGEEQRDPSFDPFDRAGFWTHSLAVAILAELIAAEHREQEDMVPEDAFVCGLLHDMGKLALDYVLPKSFARVVELADLNHGNIAEYERRILGIDHHTAGKRLAEQWGLPHKIQDAIWLHGSSYDTLPSIEHRRLVGLVSLADLIVRRHYLGYSGNYAFAQEATALAEKIGLDPTRVERAAEKLHAELEHRGKALGINDVPSRDRYLASIHRANEALGRLNSKLDRGSRQAKVQARVSQAVSEFHTDAVPGRSVQDALDAVVRSSRSLFGEGFYAMLYPTTLESLRDHAAFAAGDTHAAADEQQWLICQYAEDGRPTHSQYAPAPTNVPDLSTLDGSESMGMELMSVLPWIADFLVEAQDMRNVRLLPLTCGWGTVALLLHDHERMPPMRDLSPLTTTWGSSIAGAAQHDGARRLGEELAQTNNALAEAQDRLLRQESLARLGEMSAGAAHEMNNPLAVISGRSQLLSMSLQPGSKEQQAAQTIFAESHRLSDLITCLHMFAEPPQADRKPTDLVGLLEETVRKVRNSTKKREEHIEIYLKVKDDVPTVHVDAEQINRAVTEVLANAVQSHPKASIQVMVQADSVGAGLVIQVVDDGDGMDQHTLDHALDPFFSNKPAGRRVGMGLPRAQQLVKAHGGHIDLRSREGEGTVVTLTIPLQPGSLLTDTELTSELLV